MMLNGHALNGAPLNGGSNLVRIVVASALFLSGAQGDAAGRLALRGSGVVQAGSEGNAIADVYQTATFVASASMSAKADALFVESVEFLGTAEFVTNNTKIKKSAAAGVARATIDPPTATLGITATITPGAGALASASVNGVMDGWATLPVSASASAAAFAVREGRAAAVASGIFPPVSALPGRQTVGEFVATTEASASATGIRSASAEALVSGSADAAGDMIAGAFVDMSVSASAGVTVVRVKSGVAVALAQSIAETQSAVVTPASATLAGRAVAVAVGVRIKFAEAAAFASGSILAVARLNLDIPAPDYRRMCVPRDIRVMVVPRQARKLRVAREDRLMKSGSVTGG